MNLRDLQYLVAVASHKHFGKAADACFVSQPTLSAQLKKLEDYLGVQLVERTNRQVLLTPVGEEIVERAKVILHDSEQIVQLAKQRRDPAVGTIKLGIIPTLGPYLLPHIIPNIKQRFPKLELLLHEDQTARIIKKVQNGELDAIILALPVAHEGLEEEQLFAEPFMLATPKEHPLAAKKIINLNDLEKENVLLLAEGHCLRDQALDLCADIRVQQTNFSATSLETLRQMVAFGLGITLIPWLATKTQIANNEQVAIIKFAKPEPYRQIGILWRKNSAYIGQLKMMAEIIRLRYSELS